MRLYEVYQHLTEAQKYEQMFQDLGKIADLLPDDSDAQQYLQTVLAKIPSQIKQVRRILKRQDRIMYFLRGMKYYILTELEGYLFDGMKNAELNKDLETAQALKTIRDSVYSQGEKIINRFPNLGDTEGNTFYFDDSEFLYQIEHYLSIPYEPIQDYTWDNQTPQQIISDLQKLENSWAESQKKIFVPEPEDKPILKINDKQSWWLLPRPYCEKEGAAMSHCGNKATPRPGDRVLSYRTQVSDTEVMPHLTFVLHRDGYLGEMKGRKNQKPDKKYHPAIVKLLVEKQDLIKGISSGGHEPWNNFSIMDLEDENLREKLIDMNHNFLSFEQMLEYFGVNDERVRKKALDEIDEFAKFNDELGGFVYVESADLEDIVDYTENDLAKTVAQSLAGRRDTADWFWTTDYTPDQSTIEYAFDDYFEKNPEDEAKLKAYLKKEHDYDGEEDIFDFVYENSIDEVIDALNTAYHDGSAIGSEGEMIKDFKSALEDMPHLHYEGDNILFADQYYLIFSPDEALEWAAEDPERFADEPEYIIEEAIDSSIKSDFRFDVPQYGWDGFDRVVAFERLRDELYVEIFSKDDE